LHTSPDIIRIIKSRKMRRAGHVGRNGEMINAWSVSQSASLKDRKTNVLYCHLLSRRDKSDYVSFCEQKSTCIYEFCDVGTLYA
jgi:hypothetical protein